MCGICGYITKKEIKTEEFVKMTDSMAHRGPNDSGYLFLSAGKWNVALGHRRLSIIDISSAGHQPMNDGTGRYHIVFNGEIYNYRDLRDELKGKGYSFKSDSDTEVLLYSYVEYGEHCLQKINGMFAFAIYDSVLNTIFMARDRMGEKPLYYTSTSDGIVFASELKAIMLYPGFQRVIRHDVLFQYFARNTILPPDTIFCGVYKLGAGESITWENGNIRKQKYYDPVTIYLEHKNDIVTDYTTCKKQLRALLYDSVEKRLISDVPIGTFLSGGVDSTLISAIAKDIRGDAGVDTFCIGFNETSYDESGDARKTAKYLGVRHHEKIMNENDLKKMMHDLVKYYDEPFSDSSQLPTMLVAQFAKKSVTVVLSGDGGDELFAGYSHNDTISILQKYDVIFNLLRSVTPSNLYESMIKDRDRIIFGDKEGLEKVQYCEKIRQDLAGNFIIQDAIGYESGYYANRNGIIRDARISEENDWIQQRMLIDMVSYLPDEIMTKTDRASMRFSLEMRSPLLDHRIVDYSMRIPMKYKYAKGEKKMILKDILSDYLPKEYIYRPKKGFGAPIYKWLTGELREDLERYASRDFLEKQGVFDVDGIKNLLARFDRKNENTTTQIVWAFFIFQIWWEEYIGCQVDTNI